MAAIRAVRSERPLPALTTHVQRYRPAAFCNRSSSVFGCSLLYRCSASTWLSMKPLNASGETSEIAARLTNSPKSWRSSSHILAVLLAKITWLGSTPQQCTARSLRILTSNKCHSSCAGQRARLLSLFGMQYATVPEHRCTNRPAYRVGLATCAFQIYRAVVFGLGATRTEVVRQIRTAC